MASPQQLDEPSVEQAPVTGAKLQDESSLASFGGGPAVAQAYGAAGQLSEGVSQEAFQIAHQAKQRVDQIAVTEASTKLGLLRNQLQANAYGKHGEDAFGVPSQVMQDYQKGAQEIMGGLSNPQQQAAFAHHVSYNQIHLDHAVQLHVAHELQVYDQTVSAAKIKQEQDTAKLNWQNWDAQPELNAVDQAAQRAGAAAGQWGERHGIKGDLLAAHEKQITSQTYTGVVESMLANGQDLAASNAFKKWSDAGNFTADDKDRLARQVENGSRIGEAQRIVSKVFNTSYQEGTDETGAITITPHYPPETLQEARDQARKLTAADPKLQEITLQKIEHEWSVQRVNQKQTEDQTFEKVSNDLRKSGDFDTIQKSPEWTSLPERDKEHLEILASRWAKGQKGYADHDNPDVTTWFYGLQDSDRSGLSDIDMKRLVPEVKESTYEKMLALRSGADRKGEKTYTWGGHDEKELFDKLKSSGVLEHAGNAKSTADLLKPGLKTGNEEFSTHRTQVQDTLNKFTADQQRRPNDQERRKLLNQYVIDRVIEQDKGEPYLTNLARWGIYGIFGGGTETMPAKVERLKKAGILNLEQGPVVRPQEATQIPSNVLPRKRTVSENP